MKTLEGTLSALDVIYGRRSVRSYTSDVILPTAKRLIEAQRGTISVECPTNGGTTITVTLPQQ